MNPLDHHLDRLFRAAAQAPRPAPVEVPFAVECRVLAQWRQRPADTDVWNDLLNFLPLLRRGFALACALALLSLAVSFWEMEGADVDSVEQEFTDSAIAALTQYP
jgi:hypothetical protein